jgi:hypothetical protein
MGEMGETRGMGEMGETRGMGEIKEKKIHLVSLVHGHVP